MRLVFVPALPNQMPRPPCCSSSSLLQASLPGSSSEAPFFDVPQSLVDQWTADIEEIETALGSPFRLEDPEPVDAIAARQVCTLLTEWLQQLRDPHTELSFMEMLLLSKKLLCVDQLRPSFEAEDDTPASSSKCAPSARDSSRTRACGPLLCAALCCHGCGTRQQARVFSANCYVTAAARAAPDVLEQARLLVEQCKMLEEHGALDEATALDTVELHYPEEPFATLHDLHTHTRLPALPDRATLERCDEEGVPGQRRSSGRAQSSQAGETLQRTGNARPRPKGCSAGPSQG